MIQFVNVMKRYDKSGTLALSNVNLKIDDGEFVFITGRSGAGKSTVIHMLTCEDVPTSGDVIVNGKNTKEITRHQLPYYRREIGIVFQDFKLLPNMTVYDNVAFTLRVVGRSGKDVKRRVMKALQLVNLEDKISVFPDQLSGGEQQRVAVARAIVNGPKMIVADEPTGNIDPSLSVEIMNLLKKINSTGVTVVVVTHEQSLVNQMAERVIRIDDGHVLANDEESL